MSVNYFQKVRESVVTEIGMAPQGRRNEALNLAAYALGRHAHMDASNIDSSVIDLHTAAKAIGLQEHEGSSGAAKTRRRWKTMTRCRFSRARWIA